MTTVGFNSLPRYLVVRVLRKSSLSEFNRKISYSIRKKNTVVRNRSVFKKGLPRTSVVGIDVK